MMLSILFSFYVLLSPGHLKDLTPKNAPFEQPSEIIVSNADPCAESADIEITSKNWETVLKNVQKKSEALSCMDTRVTEALINQIIDNEAISYYSYAEQLYNHSLNDNGNIQHREFIKNEANALLFLLAEDEKKEWVSKIEKNDLSLANDINNFWKLRDPVLSTALNERLIEHWQRIAHARREFTRNNDSAFKTDDRGTIYVKYGAPSYIRSGMLFPDNTEIRSKLYDLSFFKGGINPREMFNLNMSIKQQYMPRYYEVWVYRNLGSRQPILFIFGESAERGTFGLRESVEEFIPAGSFRMGISSSFSFGAGPRGITAGPFLQMALYNELSTVDIYFGNQLSYYDQNWMRYMNGDLNFSSLKMMNSSERAERELNRIQELAPEVQSTLKRNLGYIDQSYKLYRFLNDQNEPVHKVMVFSSPHEKLLLNDRLIYEYQNPDYTIEHAARVFDVNTELIHATKKESALGDGLTVSKGNMLEIPLSVSSNNPDFSTVLISSELSRINSMNSERNQSQKIIIASKIHKLEQNEVPLNADKASPEASDIIWGYKPGNVNHDAENISFTIPVESHIPYGKNLMVYFETYHLKANPDNLYNYRVEYFINRIKRRKTLDTGISLTLNFSSPNEISKEHLEIKTSNLDPGKYRAIFRYIEPASVTPFAERIVEFTIDKKDG